MHPAIELLISRIESNPEEFAERGYGRWATIITELAQAVPPGQWKVIANKLSNIRMDKIHKQIMQELCAPTEQPEQKDMLNSKWSAVSVVSTSPELYEKFKKVSSRSV